MNIFIYKNKIKRVIFLFIEIKRNKIYICTNPDHPSLQYKKKIGDRSRAVCTQTKAAHASLHYHE